MRVLRHSLLTTTALVALSLVAATGAAEAANLEISAPGSGQTLVPSSALTVDLLTVGADAGETGTLTIGNSISVTAGDGAIIGNQTGSTGTVTVSGSGASFVVDDYLKVGNLGTGSLSFDGGATGTVTGTVYVGDYDNLGSPSISGTGHLSLSGVGTNVVVGGMDMRSLGSKSSTLSVTDGAHLTTQLGFYGRGPGSVYINGAGTVLKVGARDDDEVTYANADGWFSPDSGTIEVSGGALLDADGSYIGGNGTASMLVTGAGTRWLNGLPLFIGGTGNGNPGNGTVVVADGAYVRASTSAVGVDPGAIGKLTITGANTLYELVPNGSAGAAGNFRVGFSGTGTVTVADGATLKVSGRLDIATSGVDGEDPEAVGVLNIGAAEGEDAVAPGTIITSAWSGDPDEMSGLYFGEGDATLVFNHTSTDYSFDAMMRGTGATIKQIAGTTRLTGDSAYLDGMIYVTGGKLYANGFQNGTSVDVRDGGFFGGTGYVKDVVVGDGGVFSPGDTFGTLALNGNLQIADGGTLQIDLGPDGSDQVNMQGGIPTLTIEDGALLDVRLTAGLDLSQEYRIIQNIDGFIVKTAGFTVDDHAPLLDTLVTYSSSVVLNFAEAEIDWDDTVTTDNQKAAAAAVQALGSGNDLYDTALFLTDETIGQGFDLLSGEIHATTKSVLATDTRLLRELSMDHSQGTESSGGAMGYTSTESTAWVSPDTGLGATSRMWLEGYGSLLSSDGNGNAGAVEAKSGGMIAGVDNDLGALQVGALAGYSHSAIDQADRASTANVDTGHIGVYGGTTLDGFKVRGGGALSWNVISTNRTTILPDEVLEANYGALTSQALAELGYALDLDGVTIEPFGQLAAVGISTEAYSESGGPSALSADASFTAIGFATIGLRSTSVVVSADGQLKLSGQLAWQHAFGDTSPTAVQSFDGGSNFSVTGTPLATDTLLAQIGVIRSINDNASLGAAMTANSPRARAATS